MRVDFATTEFEFSHGRQPRGFGSWAFSLERNPDVSSPAGPAEGGVIWTHSCSYTEAKKAAKAALVAAAPEGSRSATLWVLP